MFRSLKVTAAAALLLTAGALDPEPAGAIGSTVPEETTFWALTTDSKILSLDRGALTTPRHTATLSGLVSDEQMVAIDTRPANGKLYGLGVGTSTSHAYVIEPNSGVSHALSAAPLAPALNGTEFGFDFNPTVDRIRIVSNGDQNLRVNPDTGAVAAVDMPITYATGVSDPNDGANPDLVASAYSSSYEGAKSTVLYNLDSNDFLTKANAPNDGVQTSIGDTGIDIGQMTGMDVDTSDTIWATTANGGNASLYTIDPISGAASLYGATLGTVRDIAMKLPFPNGKGYFLGAADGGVFTYGDSDFAGSAGGIKLASPIVDMEAMDEARPGFDNGQGYWLAASDGGVFSYGTAAFFGSAGGLKLAAPVVGMAAHPSNNGYWLVASDGGVFAYGGAKFYGSMGGKPLNKPIVAMASTATGQGYWLFAADGGVFAFGDAKFYGSAGSLSLQKPVVGAEAAVDGRGYYMVASDGGVFNYGPGATFTGSAGSVKLNSPVVKMAVDPDGTGYWLAASDGGVFNYGATFYGSAGNVKLARPVVAITAN